MAKDIVQRITGTRDFYPEAMAIRSWLYDTMRQVAVEFGYQQYDGPCLEPLDLYAAKSSEELVKEQSYVFTDRGGEMVTLRPELTPTLARMVAQRQQQLAFPLRWWSFGPMWRYERPQKGRAREHFQWNVDYIGETTPEVDAELIAVAATLLRCLGLSSSEAKILVNNRRLMDEEIGQLDIAAELRLPAYRLIDRLDKLGREDWISFGVNLGFTEAQLTQIQAIINDKDLWKKSAEMTRMWAAVKALGIEEYVEFAPHIIRGFDYYTGTVFEAWEQSGEFRAIFGGGRYDNLVADVGGDPVGGVGYAVGDMVLALVLEKYGCIPQFEKDNSPVVVTVFDQDHQLASLALSSELRSAGLPVITYSKLDKLGKQFRFANRKNASIVVILGPDEVTNNQVAVKDMVSGAQTNHSRQSAAAAIHDILASRQSS